jgi:hypothetical protein
MISFGINHQVGSARLRKDLPNALETPSPGLSGC